MTDEEQTKAPEEPKNTEGDTTEGDKYETTPVIERAREERERMDATLKALRKENDRREKIQAYDKLGGKSEGAAQEEVKKEETPKEYKDRIMRGEVDTPTK